MSHQTRKERYEAKKARIPTPVVFVSSNIEERIRQSEKVMYQKPRQRVGANEMKLMHENQIRENSHNSAYRKHSICTVYDNLWELVKILLVVTIFGYSLYFLSGLVSLSIDVKIHPSVQIVCDIVTRFSSYISTMFR